MTLNTEPDGVITVYEVETGRVIAQYEGLDVHNLVIAARSALARWEANYTGWNTAKQRFDAYDTKYDYHMGELRRALAVIDKDSGSLPFPF